MATQRQFDQKQNIRQCQRGLTALDVPGNRKSEFLKTSRVLLIFTSQALYKFNNLTWHLTIPPRNHSQCNE